MRSPRGHMGCGRWTHVFWAWRLPDTASLCMTVGLNQGAPCKLRPREAFSGCVWGSEATRPRVAQPSSKPNPRGGAGVEQRVFQMGLGAVSAGMEGGGLQACARGMGHTSAGTA